jgi:hydrogenase maturation factor HypF (carbamoyltransferase family)
MVSSKANVNEENAKQEAAAEAINKIVASGSVIINDISYERLHNIPPSYLLSI